MDGFQLAYRKILRQIFYNCVKIIVNIYNNNYKMTELTDEQVKALNILIQALIKGKRL